MTPSSACHRRFVSVVRNSLILLLPALAALSWQAASAAWGDRVAEAVLGQTSFLGNQPNQGSTPAASTLANPLGLSVDRSSFRLFVADRYNGRVQIWPDARTFTTGIAASQSITSDGQGGLVLDPVATATDSSQTLYIAELLNNRVLVCPFPYTQCTFVLGQPDFDIVAAGAPSDKMFNGPISVAVDGNNHLFVTDQNNNRVLRFTLPITVNYQAADLVLGQAHFDTNQVNRGQGATQATNNGLYYPHGVAVDSANNVYVADAWNNRVLRFDTPSSNGQAASLVLGQPNFTSNSLNQGLLQPTARTLRGPNALSVDRYNRLYVTDSLNNRLLGFELSGASSGAAAHLVLGQPDFGAAGYDPSGYPSDRSLAQPSGVAVDNGLNIYVADTLVNRVLRYDVPWAWVQHLPVIRK